MELEIMRLIDHLDERDRYYRQLVKEETDPMLRHYYDGKSSGLVAAMYQLKDLLQAYKNQKVVDATRN